MYIQSNKRTEIQKGKHTWYGIFQGVFRTAQETKSLKFGCRKRE